MRVTRTHLLPLSVALLAVPVACQSPQTQKSTPSPSLSQSGTSVNMPSRQIEGPPEPSAADEIAARARQDLLDSMALGNTPEQSQKVGEGTPSRTIVTWKDPSEAGQEAVSAPVRPESNTPIPAPSARTSAQPSIDTGDINALTTALARALHDRSHEGRTAMRDLTVLAALAMLDSDRTLDAETIQSLTEEERMTLQALQDWFLAMESGMNDQDAVLETVLESLRGLQASLRQTPQFGLAESSLVTRVGGFGDIDEWTLKNEEEQYNFIAHSGQEIILYLELDGFESRLDGTGRWETSTSQQLVIYSDRDGIPVWREQWQTATDMAGSRRNDYFTAQKIEIPNNLSVGKYQLKVRVRDEFSQSESEATIPFVMTAAVLSP